MLFLSNRTPEIYIKVIKSSALKKKFVTNLLLLAILNVLIKPFWIFGIDRTVQNIVGAEEYGFYFSLFNFSILLNILLDLGLTNFNNRNIAQNSHLLRKYLSNLMGLKFLLAVFYAIVCIAVAFVIDYDDRQVKLLYWLVFNQFLISFTLYLRSNISGLHFFRTDSLLSVLDRALMIVLCSILLFTNITKGEFHIEWFVYAQTVAYVIAALVALIIVIVHSGRFSIHFDKRYFLVFLKQSYPFALLIFLMAFYNRVDSVMLERLLPDNGKVQSGIYAQAFRLLDAGAMFGALFAGLLLPIFSRMLKKREDINELLTFSYLLIIVPALLIAIACGFYNKEIMALLYNSHIESSAPLLSILMGSFVAISSTYIFGTLLTANGSLRQLNLMALAGVTVNVTLNLLLIPYFDAIGAAWASLATQVFTAFAQIIIAMRVFKLTANYTIIFRLLLFIVITLLAGVICRNFSNWIIGFALLCTVGFVTAFATRLLSIKVLYLIFRGESSND